MQMVLSDPIHMFVDCMCHHINEPKKCNAAGGKTRKLTHNQIQRKECVQRFLLSLTETSIDRHKHNEAKQATLIRRQHKTILVHDVPTIANALIHFPPLFEYECGKSIQISLRLGCH